MLLKSPKKWLNCLPETRAGSPRTDLTRSSDQLSFVTTIHSVPGLRHSPSQMALLPPQMPIAQAGVTPPSPFYPSVHSLQPETTSSSNEQQTCLHKGLTHAQTMLLLPQFPYKEHLVQQPCPTCYAFVQNVTSQGKIPTAIFHLIFKMETK